LIIAVEVVCDESKAYHANNIRVVSSNTCMLAVFVY
jgi:hypothetical protein